MYNIGENIRLISDVIQYCNLKQIPGLILRIDFEKAFDTIEWKYLDQALECFNFGVTFRKWVSILYNDISSCVMNNGYASQFFHLGRGV